MGCHEETLKIKIGIRSSEPLLALEFMPTKRVVKDSNRFP